MKNMRIDGKLIEGKKILFIIPHQDDEINMCGGVIYLLSKNNNVNVLYTTNGDYIFPAEIRYREAVKSLKHLGVSPKETFFLGYADQPYDEENHIYMSNNNCWVSKKGRRVTYSPCPGGEWCYSVKGVHHQYNKIHFVQDMKSFIENKLYDIIFCIDLDFHPDHIAASLSFEKAVGAIIKEKDYHPIVLKGFAYENSYCGEKDFFSINPNGMKFKRDNSTLISNPYYDLAVMFSVPEECYSKNLLQNPIFKAMFEHKSQVFCSRAESVINSNNAFFERRTDNLALNAEISVTSGKAEYLNDFLLCDSDNIMHGDIEKIQYDCGIWIPDENDEKKEIVIQLDKRTEIEYINIYHGLKNDNRIRKIYIDIEGCKKTHLLNNEYVSKIFVNTEASKIKIRVLDTHILNGFSEIEILQKREGRVNAVKGILNDAWTNQYYITTEKELELKVYSSYGENKFDVVLTGEGVELEHNKILINSSKVNAKLEIEDYCNSLKDTIHIKSIDKIPRYLYLKISIGLLSFYQRMIRKIETAICNIRL